MTVATESRAELIERYEKLDALASLVDDMSTRVRAAGFEDDEIAEVFDVAYGKTSIALMVEIWPDDEGGEHSTESAEFRAATARAMRRKAEICAELAGPFGQEFLIEAAMRSAANAARLEATLRAGTAGPEEGGDDAA